MDQDIVNQLRESSLRLLQLENALDIERDNLINHPLNNANLSSNATYFPYLSVIDKYTGFANEYNNELLIFKDLLQKTVNLQQTSSNASAANNEVTSNYLPANILSCPVVNINTKIDYKCNAPSTNSMGSVSSDHELPVSDEKTLQLPKIQPIPQQSHQSHQSQPLILYTTTQMQPKSVKAKILNRMSYKYEGRGFEIWKKNGRKAIYTTTELYCSKTYGEDCVGIAKLKKYLIKRGGFKAICIENIKILRDSVNQKKFGLISVRDSQINILNNMNKMNDGKKVNVISFYRRRYNRSMYWTRQNKTLHVKNFDILSGVDHRKMTDLFLRFGELEKDIFINKDRLGNVYAFVQFRDIEDAIACEKNQNIRKRNNNPLSFNGRKLRIEYAGNTPKNKKNGKSRNNNLRR